MSGSCEKCSSPSSPSFTFHYGKQAGSKRLPLQKGESITVDTYRADPLSVPICRGCMLQHGRKLKLQQILFGLAGMALLAALALGSALLARDYPTSVGRMSREESTKRAFFFGASGFLALGAFGAGVSALGAMSFFLSGVKRREATCVKEQCGERLAISLRREELARGGTTHFWTPEEYRNLEAASCIVKAEVTSG